MTMYDEPLGLPPIYESEPARGGCLGVVLSLTLLALFVAWMVL